MISARKFELLCLVLLLSGMPRSARAQSTADEYQVKAALLFHFAQFLNCPADSLKAGDPSVSLCIFDDEPRRKELQSTVVGKLIGARDANHAPPKNLDHKTDGALGSLNSRGGMLGELMWLCLERSGCRYTVRSA
jgi:hypothetical protein